MGDAMAAVVGVEVVILIKEGTGPHARRDCPLGRVIKADQLALHHAAIHHLVVKTGSHQVGIEPNHLFFG